MIVKFGVNIEKQRQRYLPDGFIRFQFTSSRKRMSTILEKVDKNEHGYEKRIHMKGASEYVLESCSHYIN